MINNSRPLFVISDLHMGDGGPRDNFAVGSKEKDFCAFLDHIEKENGQTLICGDLLELWQSNVGAALKHRRGLLDKLAAMGAIYIPGNHDADLEPLIGDSILAHPFFAKMCDPVKTSWNGKTFLFAHGHEDDPFNNGSAPGWGRMMAIFAGIQEDKNGSPLFPSGQPVEEALTFLGEWLLRLWNWLASRWTMGKSPADGTHPKQSMTPAQKPGLLEQHLQQMKNYRAQKGVDLVIVGHTHEPGCYEDWYFNSGSWVGKQETYIRITPDGTVKVFDWSGGKPTEQNRLLPPA